MQGVGGTPSGGTFDNEGALTKSAGTGTSSVDAGIVFNDTGGGRISVASGTLFVRATTNVSSNGAVTVAADAVLLLSGTASLADGTTFTGAGMLAVGNSGDRLAPLGHGHRQHTCDVVWRARSRGRRSHSHSTAPLTWSSGHDVGQRDDGGPRRSYAGPRPQRLHALYLDQRTLDNLGTAVFLASTGGYFSALNLSSGATFDNQAAGTFDFRGTTYLCRESVARPPAGRSTTRGADQVGRNGHKLS